jgi:hypothetical protein
MDIDEPIPCGPVLEEVASYKKGVPAQESVEEQYTSGHYPLSIECLLLVSKRLVEYLVHIKQMERI